MCLVINSSQVKDVCHLPTLQSHLIHSAPSATCLNICAAARLTQRELSIAVGYSEAQVSRLEQNLRPPDLAALTALFIPALDLEEEPLIVSRLMELATQARGEELPQRGIVTFSHSVQREVRESVRTVEEEARNNLPLQLTSFIGREREIAEIKNLLEPNSKSDGQVRLITLLGSGGCGKTRLALEVARQLTEAYRDGVWFIELASIYNAALVLQAVTSTLGIPESRDDSPTNTLKKYLRTKYILLILDNCEQVISGTAQLVEEMLRACPHVRILATSREINNIRAALAWTLESDSSDAISEERTGRALELMLHIWPLWLNRGYSVEGDEWLNQLLSIHTYPTPARARALLLAGDFVGFRGDASGKEAIIREALNMARALGDRKRTAMALMEMGLVERERGGNEAVQFLTESHVLFQELNETMWVYRTSFLLAETYMANGEFEVARQLWNEGLDLCRAKNDRFHIAWGLEGLGGLERLAGHLEQADQLYTESLHNKFSIMDKMGIMFSLASFAQLAANQKQFKRAAILWGAAERIGEGLNFLLLQTHIPLYTSLIQGTGAALGEERFDAAWADGKAMRLQEPVNFALDLLPD